MTFSYQTRNDVCMVRKQRRSERDRASGIRKAEKAERLGRTVSAAGPSLLESLQDMLLLLCVRYIKLDKVFDQHDRVCVRWEIRGLARAIAKIRLPYEDQPIGVKQVEKEFIRKAKENGN